VTRLAVFLFDGLPLGWQALFSVAFVVVVAMFCWNAMLFVRAWRSDEVRDDDGPDPAAAFWWVFLVPALDEEITIRDSVDRLLAIPVARKLVVVIDDASDDATPEILRTIDHPDLVVFRRDLPNARIGKAAALNAAYQSLGDRLGAVDRSQVIVVVVDADGRLHPQAPARAARHFADPEVGGLQSLVRIYNRRHLLTWLQDVEFGVYGSLFQAGRNGWGTAGMGGNGQFNRLRALDDIAEGPGPWRDRLTEDQDLGLRLIARGWKSHQDLGAIVDQQGLPRLRPLLRQRTRWSQGNLQAIGLVGPVWRAPFPVGARIEALAYLLMPFWQGIVGLALLGALWLAIDGTAPFWGGGPTWQLVFVYVLAFGGTVLGCIAARRHDGIQGWILGFLIGHVYALYTWLIWPVLARSTARQVRRRGDWSKTRREPLGAADQIAA
jgi:1,2-diacylglycerol 3-beta-glucosyltransferase